MRDDVWGDRRDKKRRTITASKKEKKKENKRERSGETGRSSSNDRSNHSVCRAIHHGRRVAYALSGPALYDVIEATDRETEKTETGKQRGGETGKQRNSDAEKKRNREQLRAARSNTEKPERSREIERHIETHTHAVS